MKFLELNQLFLEAADVVNQFKTPDDLRAYLKDKVVRLEFEKVEDGMDRIGDFTLDMKRIPKDDWPNGSGGDYADHQVRFYEPARRQWRSLVFNHLRHAWPVTAPTAPVAKDTTAPEKPEAKEAKTEVQNALSPKTAPVGKKTEPVAQPPQQAAPPVPKDSQYPAPPEKPAAQNKPTTSGSQGLSFPEKDQLALSQRLKFEKPIYTVAQAGSAKIKEGAVFNTPWGDKVKVTGIIPAASVDQKQLTQDQKAALNSGASVLKLEKVK